MLGSRALGHRNAVGWWDGESGLPWPGRYACPSRGFPGGRLPLWLTLSLAWVVIAALFSGCGGGRGPERVPVSGTVTYNGKPISGTIRFLPTAATAAPMAAANVMDGNYRVDLRGGVPVGTHKVVIEAYRVPSNAATQDVAPLPTGGARGVPGAQYLPRRYNADSTLQITIPPGSPAITKNFDLTD
jgi:hypothetical protein